MGAVLRSTGNDRSNQDMVSSIDGFMIEKTKIRDGRERNEWRTAKTID